MSTNTQRPRRAQAVPDFLIDGDAYFPKEDPAADAASLRAAAWPTPQTKTSARTINAIVARGHEYAFPDGGVAKPSKTDAAGNGAAEETADDLRRLI